MRLRFSPIQKSSHTWILVVLIFVALGLLVGRCMPVRGSNEIAVVIKDFSAGMMPGVNPYVNDPTRIVWSQNFYSTFGGGRQMRFGLNRLGDTLTTNDSPVVSLTTFAPKADSGAIVYCSGGKWFTNTIGKRSYSGGPGFTYKPYTSVSRQIRPYPEGTQVIVKGDSAIGTSTRFTRDLQPNDTLTVEGVSRKIKYVRSDTKLFVTSAWPAEDTGAAYTASRSFPTGGYRPFLLSSGDFVYTGTVQSDPQVIYAKNDSLRIRHLGIVDSFYIDSVYSKYPPTPVQWDTTAAYGYRRSWDTLYGFTPPDLARYIREFQLVSRRKPGVWFSDAWLQGLNGSPQAYYVRLGIENKQEFYQIVGNSDTSIYLSGWFVDTTTVLGKAAVVGSDTSWNGSIFHGVGRTFKDTLTAAEVEGTWGYIYAATGLYDVVVADSATDTTTILGRGACFKVVDSFTGFDSTSLYNGMYFLHLTGDDVAFQAYTNTSTSIRYQKTYRYISPRTFSFPDSVIEEFPTYYCGCDLGVHWEDNFQEAQRQCSGCLKPGANNFEPNVIAGYGYRVVRLTRTTATIDAQAVGNNFYPIRYISKKTDSLFIVCDANLGLNDPGTVKTPNWEIVKVGLPKWEGMAEWNTPPQLVAWGDTSSPSLLSFSEIGDPWNWSVTRDVIAGDDPAAPVVDAVGYDDQLVVWWSDAMRGWDGQSFTEISQTDGSVGQRASVGLTKELYWLDIDGVKKMARRDFSGYSIEKISTEMDPVFNAWTPLQFGTELVPTIMVPAYRKLSVLTYNQRDRHLYLFGTFGSATKNNGCLTYDVEKKVWDGYFTIAAGDASWANIRDTARIIVGCQDSASIFILDYAYNDLGAGINGIITGGRFWITNEKGEAVNSTFMRGWMTSRSPSGGMDSSFIVLYGDNGNDTLRITHSALNADTKQIFRSPKDIVSIFWRWELKAFGKPTSLNSYQPYDITLFFESLGEDY